ncbi:FliH/SctL family protein [Alphaproteobacteria bacterium]|nr:FliH/SctL family protein [Alphaproteobacteria bacterium]
MQTADAKNDELADDLQLGPLLPEEEIPAGKLDDAEIARLVMLSSHADYHRTDNIPVKPKEAFQPRTLVTIAMEAQRRRENEQEDAAHRQAVNDAGGDAGDDTGEVAVPVEPVAAPAGATKAETSLKADNEADARVDGDVAGGADGDVAQEIILTEEEIAAQAMLEKLQAEYDRGFAIGTREGDEAGSKAGYDKGYEAGRAAGQAEASAQLETAIKGFEKATLALANSSALNVDAMTASIQQAILGLASERAGIAIADMPEVFAARIEGILAGIKTGTDHPVINLNPEDLLALKPIIETREKLQNCTFSADEGLATGDIKMVIDGIGIEDELQRRVSTKAGATPEQIKAEPLAEMPEVEMPEAEAPKSLEPEIAKPTQPAEPKAAKSSGEGFSIGLSPSDSPDAEQNATPNSDPDAS